MDAYAAAYVTETSNAYCVTSGCEITRGHELVPAGYAKLRKIVNLCYDNNVGCSTRVVHVDRKRTTIIVVKRNWAHFAAERSQCRKFVDVQ